MRPLPHRSIPAFTTTFILACIAATTPAQFPQPESFILSTNPVIAPGQHVAGPGGTGYATLAPVGHIEIFTFNYTAGETVWFQGYTNGCLDLQLRVLDPLTGFTVVASGSCDGNLGPFGQCAPNGMVLVITPSPTLLGGGYLLEVSDVGNNETGDYGISMLRNLPVTGPLLDNASLVTDTIAPSTDVDVLGFDVVQGSLVNVFLRTHGCLDLEYRILDATGSLTAGPSVIDGNLGPFGQCAVNQASFNPFAVAGSPLAPAPATGTYYILLRDSGLTEPGTYDAQVQCLFSPTGCPSTPSSFTLAVTQPTGMRSLGLAVNGGVANAPYVTAFTFDPINATIPHTGWFGGLHISFPELAGVISLGWPLIGLLDPNGQSSWTGVIPPGPFPPIYVVTVELSAGFQTIARATSVVTANLL